MERIHTPESSAAGGVEKLRILQSLDEYVIEIAGLSEPAGDETRVRDLLDFLNRHPVTSLPVERIAKAIHVSRATLQRICQNHFGMGAAHLHERIRIERAATEFLKQDITVAACAELCGYRDVYHFSRAFKRVMGMPPTGWKSSRIKTLS